MKIATPPLNSPAWGKLLSVFLLAVFGATCAVADTVYVTACVSNCVSTTSCGNGPNQDLNALGQLIYNDEGGYGAYTSAKAGNADKVTVPGSRYHSNSYSNSTPDLSGITLWPTLSVTGGIYKVYHVYSSTANNVSTNIVVGFTNVEGCTISWTNTDKFQRSFGQPSPQVWQFLGYVTNNADTSSPRLRMYFVGGMVNAGASQRLIIEQFKFVFYEPCTDIPTVGVTGPLATNSNTVVVTGVSASATNVTVYQDSGSGMVPIGQKTSGVVAGNNSVTVSGLVKGAKVAATQTINGTEGCKPAAGFGIQVGGGANPRIRIALSLKENPTATGPVGTNGGPGANSNIHFMPATTVLSGACPGDGTLTIYPSNDWQTVSIPGREGIGPSANAAGIANAGPGYNANDVVTLQVYAYKTMPGDVMVFSETNTQSAAVTSNNVFAVTWTWTAVPGASGYRLLRDVNGGGFNEFLDVPTVNYYTDNAVGWGGGNTVSPTSAQAAPSITWNGTGTPNAIVGDWVVLEAIGLASDDESDNGPFDIYIDNLANGTNGMFQGFEGFAANTPAGVVFNQPSYSGTTSGNLLTLPNIADIVNSAADSGTKSIRVRWQFTSGATNLWMRFNTFNTSVMPNPLVSMNQPISFRILIQPVGVSPVSPVPPPLRISLNGPNVQLDWTGTYQLQSATNVAGPYTDIGVSNAPYSTAIGEGKVFYRLRNFVN